jgi:hypothetical protein
MTATTTGYLVREAGPADLAGARSVMLDTFYQVFGIGYLPEYHQDVINPDAAYLRHPRHRLWVSSGCICTPTPAHPVRSSSG